MSYKKQKAILILFIITVISFYCFSQESERKTTPVEKTYNFLDNLGSADIITEKVDFM